MLNSPGNGSASSRHCHHNTNLANHHLIMKTPMCGVVAEEGAVDVEGVGVEEVMVDMVDMETTKVGMETTKVGITKVATTKVVGTMIIKVDMIIKAGMVVDMATTKADMETTKKMVDITEDGVVCAEEAIGITVGGMSMAEVVVFLVEGDTVAVDGEEWVAVGEGTEHRRGKSMGFWC